ncbi:PREDICTED: Fanconi anemia group B protein-like [Branchiostoma belcheri]|uniref:Fanconi anemia group B protein-like n=1 Tax=Branchiostoma belcheri TaxID=7741 RepID=A0A6P5AVA2_BRABE|nr:PREDICTED: Fanconi anemia group B protein-like [Branchiostoma belcheri]
MTPPRHHLVSYKGLVVEFREENSQGETTIQARVFKMDKTSHKFVQVCMVNSPELGNLYILTAKCVTEESSGSVLPCVLFRNCKGDSGSPCVFHTAFLILDGEDARFLNVRRMSTSHSMCHSDVLKTFQLLSGPQLAYSYHGDVYVTRDKQNSGTFQPVKIATSTFDPLWWGKLGNTLVAMGTEEDSSSDQQMDTGEEVVANLDLIWGHKWMYIAMATEDEDLKKRDGSIFVPHPYACVARAVHLLEYRLIKQTIDGDNPEQDDDDDVHQSKLLLATSQGQLAELEDGEVRRICELPFQDPCDVRVAYVSGGETLVLVTSATGGVCAVWGSNFKPAGHWPAAHTALTDYFLSCGTQQVLLLSGRGGDVFEGFLLTDLMGYNITEQESQTSLEDLRSLSAQKDRVIRQTCTALRAMVLQTGRITQATLPDDPSLVCLYDGQNGRTSGDQLPPSPSLPGPITVVQVWQRLVLDQWVVGLEISNQSDRTLRDVRLALVRHDRVKTGVIKSSRWDTTESTSSCRVVPRIPPSEKSGSEATHVQSKKLKLDRGVGDATQLNTTLVCVSPLPNFGAQSSVQCSLILSWREGDSKGKGSEKEASWRDFCLDVGHVKLSNGDITSGLLTVLSMDRSKTADLQKVDLLALDAVQSKTRLKVRCSHGNLRQLPQMLQSTLGFQAIPGASGLFCEQQGPLQYVRVTCTVLNRVEADLSVFTRDLPQLCLLLHSLYNILPQGTKVLPDLQDFKVKEEVEKYVTSVDTELPHVGSKLRTLLQGEVEQE